mmetsp:Transcript_60889/g.172230  ORF Transcript_60889/g.172230 Transcript_60889/m.172230 type:complete len:220 (-) Transcript_60889:250-909(-)
MSRCRKKCQSEANRRFPLASTTRVKLCSTASLLGTFSPRARSLSPTPTKENNSWMLYRLAHSSRASKTSGLPLIVTKMVRFRGSLRTEGRSCASMRRCRISPLPWVLLVAGLSASLHPRCCLRMVAPEWQALLCPRPATCEMARHRPLMVAGLVPSFPWLPLVGTWISGGLVVMKETVARMCFLWASSPTKRLGICTLRACGRKLWPPCLKHRLFTKGR